VIIGLLTGALITIALVYPRIARAFGKALAAVLIGVGVGLLVWGLYTAISGDELRRMRFGPIVLSTIGQTLGWAGGALASGITALVLSFVGRR
jgi:hypothetical protein